MGRRDGTSNRQTWRPARSTSETSSVQRVESPLEAPGVRLFGLRQSLEPVGHLLETLFPRRLRHAGIHVGVLVRLAGDRRLEIERRTADRQAGRRITDLLQKLEMAVRMPGLAFGGRPKDDGHVVVAFDVGLLRKIEVSAIGLG